MNDLKNQSKLIVALFILMLIPIQCFASEPNMIFGIKLGGSIKKYELVKSRFKPYKGRVHIMAPNPLPQFRKHMVFFDEEDQITLIKGYGIVGLSLLDSIKYAGTEEKGIELFRKNPDLCVKEAIKYSEKINKKYGVKFKKKEKIKNNPTFFSLYFNNKDHNTKISIDCILDEIPFLNKQQIQISILYVDKKLNDAKIKMEMERDKKKEDNAL